ncbi:polycystin-1 isoform X2 [Polypterus senegalus]|uniref:polycystin-1 isoform X2 n=1 Tax=Polypterus senegalus TaxID=55291 RepID=UPI0019628A02|nr:polycystin-1 isoform X2 [Polypterus senegalus]
MVVSLFCFFLIDPSSCSPRFRSQVDLTPPLGCSGCSSWVWHHVAMLLLVVAINFSQGHLPESDPPKLTAQVAHLKYFNKSILQTLAEFDEQRESEIQQSSGQKGSWKRETTGHRKKLLEEASPAAISPWQPHFVYRRTRETMSLMEKLWQKSKPFASQRDQRPDGPHSPHVPCPHGCVCNSTAVNCSGVDLREVPPASSCPSSILLLDLSRNRITDLKAEQLEAFKNLTMLDVSHNEISTIKEGIFGKLPNLQLLRLGANSYSCDCSMSWLKKWIEEHGTVVKDKEKMTCISGIPVAVLDAPAVPCADSFVSCVSRRPQIADAVLLFSHLEPRVHTRRSCNAVCYQRSHSHFLLHSGDFCLCGSLPLQASRWAEAGLCWEVCSNADRVEVCGRRVLHNALAVQVTLNVSILKHYSLYQLVMASADTDVPDTIYQWDFGDGSVPYNVSARQVFHKYGLPGTYTVTVLAFTHLSLLSESRDVIVSMPVGQLGLQCPRLIAEGQTMEILLHVQRGTELSAEVDIKDRDGQKVLAADLACPTGGCVHLTNLRCYWLSPTQDSWPDARHICQGTPGADLLIVGNANIQSFILQNFLEAGSVWIGLSEDSQDVLHWVDGSRPDSFTNWGPAADTRHGCILMDMSSGGLWTGDHCGQKNFFICEKSVQGLLLPNVETFLTGVPIMTGSYPQSNISLASSPLNPASGTFQLMVFPGLWFSHTGQVVSIEFVAEPLKQRTVTRFQVLRPYCSPSQHLVPPGCEFLQNPFACCSSVPLCNTTGGCPSGQQWCHLRESCLPVSSPCSSYAFENISSNVPPMIKPPRHIGLQPFYFLVKDLPVQVPPSSEPTHYNIHLAEEEIHVYPDDIVAIQHTSADGPPIRCQKSLDSPWRQSYMMLSGSSWWENGLTVIPAQPSWVDEVICDLRVLYSERPRSFTLSPTASTGLSASSSYAISVTVGNAVSSATSGCTVEVRTSISGLQMIYPRPVGGKIHLTVNQSALIVVKILSGANATSTWSYPVQRAAVQFQPSCPPSILNLAPGCKRDTTDTWFSFAWVSLLASSSHVLHISVSNEVSSQNLSVTLESHEEITGLEVSPSGMQRLLVDVPQTFAAHVSSGSSVVYSWIIDNQTTFTYTGQMYTVVFNRPAVYNLKVLAENPVSSMSLEVQLLADFMNPLADPQFVSLAEVMAANVPQEMSFQVKADMSIGITVRWDFGDGSPPEDHSLMPPYDQSLLQPDPSVEQVYVLDLVNHTYTQPGEYTVQVQVFNSYNKTGRSAPVRVCTPLTALNLSVTPFYPQVNQSVTLQAFPTPTAYGVQYSWNFGDGSPLAVGPESAVQHIFHSHGLYNVTLMATNALNEVTAWQLVEAEEPITGLWVTYDGPTELGLPTVLKGSISTGTGLTWTFDLGNGQVYARLSENSFSFIYEEVGNYTANITVRNQVSEEFQAITVEVYELRILGVLPSGCVVTKQAILFEAVVSRMKADLRFIWSFGDGSLPSEAEGTSSTTHTYYKPGSYLMQVTVFRLAMSASVETSVCVEDPIAFLNLTPSNVAVATGEEICFTVEIIPKPGDENCYEFLWDFSMNQDSPLSGLDNYCYVFHQDGTHHVTVTAKNNVSSSIAKGVVLAQSPVGEVLLNVDDEETGAVALNKTHLYMADTISGSDVTFQWEFGDGSPVQQGQNLSYAYKSTGQFVILVTAWNVISKKEATLEMSVVVPIKEVILSTSHNLVEVGQPITIMAKVDSQANLSFFWQVGPSDSTVEGPSTLKHVFQFPGVYNITVWAKNMVSKAQATVTVEVFERISGLEIFSSDLIEGRYITVDNEVLLKAQISRGSKVTFEWTITHGGNNTLRSQGDFYRHVADKAEDLLVKLKAQNPLHSVIKIIELRAVELVAGVKVSTVLESVEMGVPVEISVSVVSGTDLQYTWYVEDDQPPVTTNISYLTHAYRSTGLVLINVTVSNVLGFSVGSTELHVQEAISGLDFQIPGSLYPFYVETNISIKLHGYAAKGTDLRWEWYVYGDGPPVCLLGQETNFSFQEASTYQVSLNVSNDVSWEEVSHNVVAQDAIYGLTISANQSVVCAGEPVLFTLNALRGTDIRYSLQFPSFTIALDRSENTFETSALSPGYHVVVAKAENNVSVQLEQAELKVVEKISGLQIANCCSQVLEANKEVLFYAQVTNGSHLSYQWCFQMLGYPDFKAVGQNIIYAAPNDGTLVVTVVATNDFCSLSLNKSMKVQSLVLQAELYTDMTDTFTDQAVTFWVLPRRDGDLYYQWNFGDSGKVVVSQNDTATYSYRAPGTFQVKVKVFNNISSFIVTRAINVQRLQCGIPKVQLIQKQTTILKSRSNYFEARLDLQGCTAYRATYLWEAFQSPDCQNDQVSLGSCDVSTPLLILPKLSLDLGAYCLKFTATLQGTPLQSQDSLNITVVQSPLVALIKGGSQIVWSVKQDLLLDGTDSYDPDVRAGEDGSLIYHWECVVQERQQDNPKMAPFFPCSSFSPTNTSLLLIPNVMLIHQAAYVFTLTIFKPGKQAASSSQTVTTLAGKVLPVTIECHSCNVLSSYSVSQSIQVTLSGKCKDCSNTSLYQWRVKSSDSELLVLDNSTTTTGPFFPDLVILQGVLRDGVNYTFTLTVQDRVYDQRGFASITLVSNYPPNGGTCTLEPDSIIYLLETPVTYICTGWTDEDDPLAQLIFTLVAEICQEDPWACHTFMLYRGTNPTFTTLVPLGSAADETTINIVIHVEDSLGSSTVALNRTLTVSLPLLLSGFQDLTDWLKNKSQSELWGVVQQGNPQEVIPYSIALISALNKKTSMTEDDLGKRISIRSNITKALTSLNISTAQDVTQLSAALAQCVAFPSEFVCDECQRKTLEVTKKMISILGDNMKVGDVTPTSTGTSILQILGGSMAAVNFNSSNQTSSSISEHTITAYMLTGTLMKTLMRSRMCGEGALSIQVPKIKVTGQQTSPANILCTKHFSSCHFYIPQVLSHHLQNAGALQILMTMDINLFSSSNNHSISTSLAAMEFATPDGHSIPISNLSNEDAIQVKLSRQSPTENRSTTVEIPPRRSVNFTIGAVNSDPHAGLYISFNFTLQASTKESNGSLAIFIDDSPGACESQNVFVVKISVSSRMPAEHTVFFSPLTNDTTKVYYVNVSSHLMEAHVQASVCVFTSLCHFFDLTDKRWSSTGLQPMAAASPSKAHCLTQHLTLFGASLFVFPDAVIFLPPADVPARNNVVAITCAILWTIYLAVLLIAHKLDDIDVTHVGVIPLCGQSGRYRYQVMVKTGWTKGSGTSAHVGISLYGLNKSGSRHLDKEGAFQRNGLDVFQIETDANLGEIWKIRIWHDNTGMDPSWYLQYVIVWDRQTDNMYFFLVDDWLSVENEKNEGLVEKEVLAACPQELRTFNRIFCAQLVRGISDRHIWVSVWDRPPRSRFTRVQRVTCCNVLLFLYLGAGAMWYGAVGEKGTRDPVSARAPVNAESIAVGMTVAILALPVYLFLCFLFRRTRSKVTVEDSELPPAEPQTVEMEVYLEHSELGSSSFLSLPGGLDSIMDGSLDTLASLGSKKLESGLGNAAKQDNESFAKRWPSCDSIFDIPDLLSGEPAASRSHILKRKKALLKLGIESPSGSDDDPLSFSLSGSDDTPSFRQCHLTVSEEDLMRAIAAEEMTDRESSGRVTSDSGRFSPRLDTDFSDALESSCSGWSDLSDERKMYKKHLSKSPSYISGFSSAASFRSSPELNPQPTSSFSSRIGVPRRPPAFLLPNWVLVAAYLLAMGVMVGGTSVTVLYGLTFNSSVVLLWMISSFSAFLTSALLVEPIKVVLEALFLALVLKPVDPDDGDTLVEEPLIKKAFERIGKVRAPYGYALLHAKEEARKVRALHTLMKKCVIHLLFLLVVLLVNYQGGTHDSSGRQLHATVRRTLVSSEHEDVGFATVRSTGDVWRWMDSLLIPHLYKNPAFSLLGVPRLRQLCFQNGCYFGEGEQSHGRNKTFSSEDMHRGTSERPPCSSPGSAGFWYWGQFGVYNDGGESVELGESDKETEEILIRLQRASWINSRTKVLFVEFTQYHQDTGQLVTVTMTLEWPEFGPPASSDSIQLLHVYQSGSVLDLLYASMVMLLVFGVCFLTSELWAVYRERGWYFQQGRRYLQVVIILLSLGIAGFYFAYISFLKSQLQCHRSRPNGFTDFRRVAQLFDVASSLSAILLTILTLKIARQLRFVRKWSVFGKAVQQAWWELFMASVQLLFLLGVFAQSGYLLFSTTLEEFQTFSHTYLWLVSMLRGRAQLGTMIHKHPLFGPSYILSYVVCIIWVFGRLFGAVVICCYKMVQTEQYRPALEPQDYEMVEFFIKRFKLWMGISKTKEFRHKVKFEGIESLPSRSSQTSKTSPTLTDTSEEPRTGSAISSGSEDSILLESSQSAAYDVQVYLERLLPTVNSLLTQFDRVNKVTDDLLEIESDLQRVQRMATEKRRKRRGRQRTRNEERPPSVSIPSPSPSPATFSSRAPFQFPRSHTTFPESPLLRPLPLQQQTGSSSGIENCRDALVPPSPSSAAAESRLGRAPRRRAWYSGPPLSADFSQRTLPTVVNKDGDRPKSEEGKGRRNVDCAPVKRRAWHNEGS